MSSAGGVGHERGAQAREGLRAELGLSRLARGYQVHGTRVVRVRGDGNLPQIDAEVGGQPPGQADGQATDLHNLGALVLTADCLPVALGSERSVAMVHAGWRGLAAGILEEGLRALRELGGEGDLVAVIGPGAGPCCYEVGPEVQAAFGGIHRDRRGHIDLKAIARERLLAAGVSEVRDVAACTICDERFFSHRREGARAGRQGGVAWLS
ncbi:MAG: polyphenol oxidase family protein [Solirubrobacteraceae bacterium]